MSGSALAGVKVVIGDDGTPVIEGPIRAYSLAKQTFFQAETAGKHGTERHKQRH